MIMPIVDHVLKYQQRAWILYHTCEAEDLRNCGQALLPLIKWRLLRITNWLVLDVRSATFLHSRPTELQTQ